MATTILTQQRGQVKPFDLESYLNPNSDAYTAPEQIYTELRTRVIFCLGSQRLIDEYCAEVDAEPEIGGKLLVTRSWCGWILTKAYLRENGRAGRCPYCGRDVCSH